MNAPRILAWACLDDDDRALAPALCAAVAAQERDGLLVHFCASVQTEGDPWPELDAALHHDAYPFAATPHYRGDAAQDRCASVVGDGMFARRFAREHGYAGLWLLDADNPPPPLALRRLWAAAWGDLGWTPGSRLVGLRWTRRGEETVWRS